MKILVINAGSSSLKYQLIEMENESVLAKGVADRIGLAESAVVFKGKDEVIIKQELSNHEIAVKYVLQALLNENYGVIRDASEISAVGHRVVAGGEEFSESALITPETLKKINSLKDLAPLHMPPAVMGINACLKVMPHVSHVAVFDTAFHSTMPEVAKLYGIAYEDYKEYKIRRYGFHGSSHKFVAGEVERITKGGSKKLVICHLGNGASLSAVKDGKCVDTSMGFTPLEGLIMGTRSGDIDPSVVEYLCNKKGFDVHKAVDYLNKSCGVKGISGVSSDFRDLVAEADKGNARANLAIDMFCYRVSKYIGGYMMAMGGLDFIAFTAGIGENTAKVREKILDGMEFLGLKYDKILNNNCPRGENIKLSVTGSKIDAYIIPTNEELVIARDTVKFVN